MWFLKAFIAIFFLLLIVITVGCRSKPELSYEVHIKPILKKHCYECHLVGGKGYEASGFLMESYENVMKGTKFGEVIIPGSGITSTLYLLVAGKTDPSIRMPHGKFSLPEEHVETIKTWIDQGAKNN